MPVYNIFIDQYVFFMTGKMHKTFFFPGRMSVTFRKGPLGYLCQDPREDNSSLQDKSASVKEEPVRQNALTVVRLRWGDASDKIEVAGEYILQFGKYKGKSFRWLLENDIGYTIYLIRNQQKEETAGVFMAEGHSKDSLLSFVSYAQSFQEIQSLLNYEEQKPVVTAAAALEDDQLVGFGQKHLERHLGQQGWWLCSLYNEEKLCSRDNDAQATTVPAEEAALTLWLLSGDTYLTGPCWSYGWVLFSICFVQKMDMLSWYPVYFTTPKEINFHYFSGDFIHTILRHIFRTF